MDDRILSPGTMLGTGPSSIMDLDVMDELLLQGYWLETMCGSEFLQHSPLDNTAALPSEEEASMAIQSVAQNIVSNPTCIPGHLGYQVNDGSDLRRAWWIGPSNSPGAPATSVRDRLIRALGYIQDLTKDKDVLIQVWVPVSRGGRRVLMTCEQPFSLNPGNRRLSRYRDISVNYQFSAEENSKEMKGMPGRVFLEKVPEWSPDVRFYRNDEYARVDHAQQFDVRGILALPVFEQGSRTCLGVIEVVMTTQKIKYRPEIENVCKALEAFDLRSSHFLSNHNIESCRKSYEAALPEILEVLRSACDTHGLPLAQTWALCIQQGKEGCRHSDENLAICISPVEAACYVADPRVQGFHEACSEHHLLKGQGVVGKAFLTNQPCFSPDVSTSGKIDYPLSHHARMFGLCGAVSIRFRNIQTGASDFVLEFFLPVECKVFEEQKAMLTSLSIIIQKTCTNLRVVTDEELRDEVITSPINQSAMKNSEVEPSGGERMPGGETVSLKKSSSREDSHGHHFVSRVDAETPQLAAKKDMMGEVFSPEKSIDFRDQDQTASLNTSSGRGDDHTGDNKRPRGEKTITLQVLRQHFSGSLKDAAKSLGVCPTTLKRICRQHGINRWPSRKIKKVGHSLQKLKVVIDSVEGASGSLELSSFYSSFPELASPNVFTARPCNTENVVNTGPHSTASKSHSSSYSWSSSSSQCCSSGSRQAHSVGSEDPAVLENAVTRHQLKRVRSEVELNGTSQDAIGAKLTRKSTQSHKILKGTHKPVGPPAAPVQSSNQPREGELLRVKVTYGEQNIRFRLQKGWQLSDIWREISKRFNVDDPSRFNLRYLDDDSEWVLLTCNADLEECIYVITGLSRGNTIRLSLQASSQHHHGSVVASSGHV
ncbi:hypothetical protein SAY87_004973 [Trapa incisa]|uniref:Uncharacterized protein n=1 Tax=Trapa incisa TaxID=236973 RepID=A0AAN7JQ28_9MYRT|nr:hypothetical protein SAY87_004973 [Trapa incisa]